MKQNSQIQKEEIPIAMAIMDYLPVFCFLTIVILVYLRTGSILFLSGGCIVTLGGLFKAGWKLICSLTGKDLRTFTKLFHILLPCGFVIMLCSIPFALEESKRLFLNLFTMPSIIPSVIGSVGMVLMLVFAFTLDKKKASSNWIEQSINSVSQLLFILSLCIMNQV